MEPEAIPTKVDPVRLTVAILFFNILLGAAGSVIITPVLPTLLSTLTSQGLAANSIWSGLLFSIYGLMQLLFAPVVGSLSDRYGRRSILLLSSLAFSIDYAIMATAQTVELLFLGRLISGITGAAVVVAFASTADISDPASRSKRFALMYVASGLGLILGPALSGLLFQLGVRAPFWGASAANAAIFVITLCFFKETLPRTTARPLQIRGPFGSFGHFSHYPGFSYMFAGHLLFIMAVQAPASLWAFYTASRLGWSAGQTSMSLVLVGALTVLVQTTLVRYSYPRFGMVKNCYAGFFFLSLSLLLFSFSQTSAMFYLALVPYSLSTLSNSAVMSIYSSHVPPDEQGSILGVLSSINSLASVTSPVLMSYIYSQFYSKQLFLRDGAPFFLGFVLTVVSIALFYKAFREQTLASSAIE